MKKIVILAFFVLSTAALAQVSGPGSSWTKEGGKPDRGRSGTVYTRNTGSAAVQGYSVPEPAAIGLLGAGLVSLGIYAKRKQGKKR